MTTTSTPNVQFLEFDPFGDDFRANPEAFHQQLLDISPGFMIMDGGTPSAYVATYEQCMQVLGNWEVFSSVKPPGLPGMQRVDFFNSQPVMNYSDPPQHDRLRRVVNAAFAPGRVRMLAEASDRIVDDLLDKFSDGQAIDAVEHIARPFAIKVLFDEFLGISEAQDQQIFFDFVSTFKLLDKLEPGDPKPREYVEAWKKGEAYCRDALARALRDKTDSLMGMIAAASETGTMSDAEMMAMVCVLFSGGVPTVSAMASSAVHYLAHNPEIAARIRQDESLAKAFCEETYRIDAPVTMVMRFCTQDVEVGSATIARGMPVYTMISVANRDPAVYDNPLTFNIDRKNMRHLAFGNGLHVCIGNAITRMMLPKIVVQMARRFPRLCPDPSATCVWETSPRSRHRAKAPVRIS